MPIYLVEEFSSQDSILVVMVTAYCSHPALTVRAKSGAGLGSHLDVGKARWHWPACMVSEGAVNESKFTSEK